MIEIEISEGIQDEFTEKIDAAAKEVFTRLNLSGQAKAELDFVTYGKIWELNKLHRQKDKATDVLSFPMIEAGKAFTKENYPFDTDEDGFVRLGNIVISPVYAGREAEEYGITFLFEITHLFVHGLLHLLGYDHEDEQSETGMRAVERAVIEAIGLEWECD